jgi:hypothetical protein
MNMEMERKKKAQSGLPPPSRTHEVLTSQASLLLLTKKCPVSYALHFREQCFKYAQQIKKPILRSQGWIKLLKMTPGLVNLNTQNDQYKCSDMNTVVRVDVIHSETRRTTGAL